MNFAEVNNSEMDLRDLPVPNSMKKEQNGRVAFDPTFSAGGKLESIPGYGHETKVETNFIDDMLRGNWEKTALSAAFFSPENIKLIQNAIRKEVYNRSGEKRYVIDDQSVDELKIIMRGMYYQYARNLDTGVSEQVQDLNQKVINWSAPHILSAVDHYYYYINDISHMPVPMQQPQNISRAGTRSLPANPYM
uniref:Minor capsid protein P8 central region domain-containing protein n=1 Tax=viral metagenome TaxID=1070528 RepID=A0A6C0D778_9ZZZZ